MRIYNLREKVCIYIIDNSYYYISLTFIWLKKRFSGEKLKDHPVMTHESHFNFFFFLRKSPISNLNSINNQNNFVLLCPYRLITILYG